MSQLVCFSIAAALLLSVHPAAARGFQSTRRACRCLPSDQSCWPSSQDWKSFNLSIEGALISSKPPASPCHDPFFDQTSCDLVKQKWNDVWWRSDQPGATQSPHFEIDGESSCLIGSNRSSRCLQGSVPIFTVRVSKSSQVQAAVAFADRFNLRLVVKNTGHEFTGRTSAPGSLNIWMHNLKGITFMDRFTPSGGRNPGSWWDFGRSKQTSVVKVGAGVQWEELYKAAFENRKTVVGAQCTSVGAAGGFPQGGGHSQISPSFGLAADNVVEYEVVTANGKVAVANSYQNQELFWALRGGGGGTFGVVVSVTYATFPPLQSLVFASYTFTTNITSTYKAFLSHFILLNPFLSDFGWGGVFYLTKNSISVQYLLPNKNMNLAERSFRQLLNYADFLKVAVSSDSSMQLFNSYYEWHLAVQCPGDKCGFPSGFSIAEVSRLVPRSVLEFSSSKLADALISFVDAGYARVSAYLVGGGKVRIPQSNAVNPVWRQSLLHVLVAGLVPEVSSARVREAATLKLSMSNKVLRNLTPWSGSYLNEADFYEPNWQQSFFGRNYGALKYIKDKVDPKGLFVCRHCVGSEDWSEDLNCPRN